jgi:branched-chain amino acid aminotransferase
VAFPKASTIWFNGRLVPWDECKVHVLAHGLHYGTSVFEGMRSYDTELGPAVFRLREHMRRLVESAKVQRLPIPYDVDALSAATLELLRANQLRAAYIRPVAYLGYSSLLLDTRPELPIDVAIAAFPLDRYLGDTSVGLDVAVSSWVRAAGSHPALAKAAGNYLPSRLASMEAHDHGYAEALMFDANGMICEGAAENLFMVADGVLVTPPTWSAILRGITRDSVIDLARELGVTVVERPIAREQLYLADEVFLTGTATEVAPVATIDRLPVADGKPGPITKRLQAAFDAITRGGIDKHGWLSFRDGEPTARNR